MRPSSRAIVLFGLFAACAFITAGCTARQPEAMGARDYFGQDIDFGFVTGCIVVVEAVQGQSGCGTAFPIGPAALVTAGHAFMGPSCKPGYRGLGYGEVPPPKAGDVIEITGEPDSPWKEGQIIRLSRLDQDGGDFALIQMRCPLPKWDRSIDPTVRPQPGEIVVVGSPNGRADDRVLTVVEQPASWEVIWRTLPGMPRDAVFARPALGKGWSGSPVKAMRSTGTTGNGNPWVTFGCYSAGLTAPNRRDTYAIIVPLPADILQYVDLPPAGDDEEPDPA